MIALTMPASVSAFPDREKASLSLVSSQATSFIAQSDRFLFLSFSNKIFRIDTETFALTSEQVPLLEGDENEGIADTGGDVTGLSIRGNSLFAAQSDGDLLTINLDDLAAEPDAFHVIDGSFGEIAADPEAAASDDQVYLLNPGGNSVVVFDTGDETSGSVTFVDGLGSPVSPEAIVFVPFVGGNDKIYVTSNRGLVFVLAEGAVSLSGTITISATNKDLPAAAATPDGDFLLVVDATDKVVHVIDTATDTLVDTDPIEAGVNPIPLSPNSAPSAIAVTEVARPDDLYAYISGSSGLSVIDLNLNIGGFGIPEVIDFNDGGSGDDTNDPLTLSSTPHDLVASSVDDGYVYASVSNANVSVITDKPFVSITGTSLGDGTFSEGESVALTFQTDVTGSFRVTVGDETTQVASGTVDTAGVDVTTPDIAFDAGLFGEGANRVFVFVTDADGLTGRDAVDITVDTPPPGIEVISTSFGDQKIFLTFRRLDQSDIDHYNLYVDSNAEAVGSKSEIAGTITQPSSGDEVKAKVTGLENGVTYFIGLEAVDTAGNTGARTTTFPDGTPVSATPEATVGLAEAVGEGGCSLIYGRP
ncbi:MAG TPA: hypothetical protein VLJ37_00940 [bacterium]|nr:hypothetical protein [bacterium]